MHVRGEGGSELQELWPSVLGRTLPFQQLFAISQVRTHTQQSWPGIAPTHHLLSMPTSLACFQEFSPRLFRRVLTDLCYPLLSHLTPQSAVEFFCLTQHGWSLVPTGSSPVRAWTWPQTPCPASFPFLPSTPHALAPRWPIPGQALVGFSRRSPSHPSWLPKPHLVFKPCFQYSHPQEDPVSSENLPLNPSTQDDCHSIAIAAIS